MLRCLSARVSVACVASTLAILACCGPAAAGPATAASGGDMLTALNATRAAHGLPLLRVSRGLSRGSGAHARKLARTARLQHASRVPRGSFRRVGEILGLMPGAQGGVRTIVRAWLGSATHRPILLNRRYRFVGVGAARGSSGGRKSTFWVVRFGQP